MNEKPGQQDAFRIPGQLFAALTSQGSKHKARSGGSLPVQAPPWGPGVLPRRIDAAMRRRHVNVMAREILSASREGGENVRFLLEVVAAGPNWTSTLARLDARGEPLPGAVAPRFYGVTAEQARRRMIQVLENEYDEVASEGAEPDPR